MIGAIEAANDGGELQTVSLWLWIGYVDRTSFAAANMNDRFKEDAAVPQPGQPSC